MQTKLIILLLVFLFSGFNTKAQLLKKIKDAVKQGVEAVEGDGNEEEEPPTKDETKGERSVPKNQAAGMPMGMGETIPASDQNWIQDFVPQGVLEAYVKSGGAEAILKQELKELMKMQYGKISGFPAFIHFAFIISPTLARTQFNVKEETITSEGQTVLTKMTITSGKDAGYIIIFDQYGRLVHLRDTHGDTADYWYDKDVTVNIPPYMVMNMGKF